MANPSGTASLSLDLGGAPPGIRFYNQGGVFDPGANPLGVIWSGGACARLATK